MNITEANEYNTLLDWVLAGSDPAAPDAGKAKRAAEFLAGRAYKTLIAGTRPDEATAAWPTPTSAPEDVTTHGA